MLPIFQNHYHNLIENQSEKYISDFCLDIKWSDKHDIHFDFLLSMAAILDSVIYFQNNELKLTIISDIKILILRLSFLVINDWKYKLEYLIQW